MEQYGSLKEVFSGMAVDALYIKEALEENGIGCMMRDLFSESSKAGWVSSLPQDSCRLYVSEDQVEAAQAIVTEWLNSREGFAATEELPDAE